MLEKRAKAAAALLLVRFRFLMPLRSERTVNYLVDAASNDELQAITFDFEERVFFYDGRNVCKDG